MRIEDTLNGKYASLYGEVVTADVYHMRDVADIVSINDPTHIHEKGHSKGFNFIPDVIIDLGANIGIFTRYARELFPNAVIVSVEPNKANRDVFKQFTPYDPKIILIPKGIGSGELFRVPGADNGAMECYVSEGPGFSEWDLEDYNTTTTESILLRDLKEYLPGRKSLLKMDIEGAEHHIFGDYYSMEVMKSIDYIAAEIHYHSANNDKAEEVKKVIDRGIAELSKTHHVIFDNVFLYANRL